jgi:hypothetical protein
MIAQLTDELRDALRQHEPGPLPMVDPATNRHHVLIAQEQYDRLKPLFEGEPLTHEEQRRLIQDAGRRAGWDDPEFDAYDHYDEHRSKQP